MKTRREHDLLGELDIPANAYYGIQTYRGMQNFQLTGKKLKDFPAFVKGMAVVKQGAALANNELGLLDTKICKAIVKACEEISEGALLEEFPVDMIQGGAGTSTNMNANEVIANRALEILGKQKGEYEFCHPNNHVNMAQSTNDAYPCGARLGIIFGNKALVEETKNLVASFRKKANEMGDHIKIGRTQLQDAVPMTYRQEFESYAATIEAEIKKLIELEKTLYVLNMGATAIGTGINADPSYAKAVAKHLAKITKLPITTAKNLIAATNDTSDFVSYSSELKRLALKITKICNDLRLLSSGPRTGFAEIKLPARQPGSSIMPGKVNPVIPEAMNQIAFRVIGNDLTVSLGSENGQLELNVFEPVMLYSIFESVQLLINGMKMLRLECVDGIEGNFEHGKELVYNSISLVTALNPVIGYEASSSIAKAALAENRSVYDLVLERNLLDKATLDKLLRPENMTKPHSLKKSATPKKAAKKDTTEKAEPKAAKAKPGRKPNKEKAEAVTSATTEAKTSKPGRKPNKEKATAKKETAVTTATAEAKTSKRGRKPNKEKETTKVATIKTLTETVKEAIKKEATAIATTATNEVKTSKRGRKPNKEKEAAKAAATVENETTKAKK